MGHGRGSREQDDRLPERIGRHELLIPIARGGMGVVYLARTHGAGGFEREVALKLLHRTHGDRHAHDLVEEAKLASLIRHPNVVQVFDVDEGPLGVYMSMEYVEGTSLHGLLAAAKAEGSRIPPEIGLRILLDALAGLAAAHDLVGRDGRPLGIVHRDFSPQNILVGVDGAARLTDFGIAKAASRAGHTATGTVKGKIAYMAPEQIRGQPLDRRCDVWAAGMIAWEVMAGHHLFDTEADIVMMYRITHDRIPLIRDAGVDVPVALDEAIARALVQDPAARCPSADAFARTLEASGLEPAPADEVAAYVRRLVGDDLAARRAKIAEVVERRRSAPPPEAPAEKGGAPGVSLPPRLRSLSDATTRRIDLAPRTSRAARLGAAAAVIAGAALAWKSLGPAATPGERPDAAPSARTTEGVAGAAVSPEAPAASTATPARAEAETPATSMAITMGDPGRVPHPPPIRPANAGDTSAPPAPPPRKVTITPAVRASSHGGAAKPLPLAPSPYGRSP